MKKIILSIIIFLLMINFCNLRLYATEESTVPEEEVVEEEIQIEEKSEETENEKVLLQASKILKNSNIIVLFAIFIISIFLVAGKHCIKPIINIVFASFIIYFIAIKRMYSGHNAIVSTLFASLLIMSFSFILSNGFNKKALSEILATFCSSIISGIIAIIFSNLEKIPTDTVSINSVDINTIHLIFAGVSIATLGVCIDIINSIVTALNEFKVETDDFSRKELFDKGMEIGKEIILSKSIILTFAFLGSGLLSSMLMIVFNESTILNNELIMHYLIAAISGSIEIIISIPIISIIYAILNHKKTIYKVISNNKLDGNRSLKIK